MASLPVEEWRPVIGIPGYCVSNLGRVLSLPKEWIVHGAPHRRGQKILKPRLVSKRYCSVLLARKGESPKGMLVHRLVCEAWHGERNGRQTNHKNGIKTDNRAENLEWVTPTQNVLHAYGNNLKLSIKGSNHGGSIISESDAMDIYNSDLSGVDIAKRYKISQSSVSAIRMGRLWRHVNPPRAVSDSRHCPAERNKGSDHGMSKLSENDVRLILIDKRPNTQIAKSFSVTPSTISCIKKRRAWRHVL